VRTRTGEVLDLEAVRSLALQLPDSRAQSLKVWLHRVTADGRSQAIAGEIRVDFGGADEVRQTSGNVVVPLVPGRPAHAITISKLEL
jgi:hypothetical protein